MAQQTDRGFDIIEFEDDYGTRCSLQESSSAIQNKIWLGAGNSRMLLTVEQVAELLPYLNRFVETGELV